MRSSAEPRFRISLPLTRTRSARISCLSVGGSNRVDVSHNAIVPSFLYPKAESLARAALKQSHHAGLAKQNHLRKQIISPMYTIRVHTIRAWGSSRRFFERVGLYERSRFPGDEESPHFKRPK